MNRIIVTAVFWLAFVATAYAQDISGGGGSSGMNTGATNALSTAQQAMATAAGSATLAIGGALSAPSLDLSTFLTLDPASKPAGKTGSPTFYGESAVGFNVFLGTTGGTATIDLRNVPGGGATYALPSAAGNLIGSGDTGTVTNTMLAGSIDLSTKVTGTLANASVGPTPWSSGTGATLVAPRAYYECTTTCSITLPTPAAGYEFCVRNANNVATVITFAGIASVQFEVQAQTSYKSANTSIVSGGAVTDRACWVGKDATHYDVGTLTGTWS